MKNQSKKQNAHISNPSRGKVFFLESEKVTINKFVMENFHNAEGTGEYLWMLFALDRSGNFLLRFIFWGLNIYFTSI